MTRKLTCLKLTLESYLEPHILEQRATDRAAVFDELGMRMCWLCSEEESKKRPQLMNPLV